MKKIVKVYWDRIQKAREFIGIWQEELAFKSKVSKQTIINIEGWRYNTKREVLEKIVKVLNKPKKLWITKDYSIEKRLVNEFPIAYFIKD